MLGAGLQRCDPIAIAIAISTAVAAEVPAAQFLVHIPAGAAG